MAILPIIEMDTRGLRHIYTSQYVFDDYDVTFDRVLAKFEAKTFAYTHPGV